jgi:hypothetical protein
VDLYVQNFQNTLDELGLNGEVQNSGRTRIQGFGNFNQALLAKQGWRIILNPNTLTARILRAKYYQNSSFIEVPIRARASFVWRSICSVRSLLLHGLLWRVGDGKSIKIWGDRWLPTPITHYVQSPPKIIGPESMVNVLIDQDRGCWKQ